MKIVGHRGAAGLALENTIASIQAAKKAGVDAIEFDIRLTADGHFMLCHDVTTKRISTKTHNIGAKTKAFLTKVLLHNDEPMPSLDQALKAAGTTPVFIEVKGSDWAKQLARALKTQSPRRIYVIAIDHAELIRFHALIPEIKTFAVQQFHAAELFETIKTAQRTGLTGVDMNFWLLNPLTYWLAKRQGLEVMVYTVNQRWIAWFLNRFFPDIAITTDKPHIMQFLRTHAKQTDRH